jgi:hypothetical protein
MACFHVDKMAKSTDGRGRRSCGGGDRDGRLHISALTNGRAAVHVLGSASLRADTVDRHRASSRVRSISVENEEALGSARMGKLARGGGNRAIAAYELQRWAHEAMQIGALPNGGKGKRKTGLQGPEHQGLADNTADGSRAKRMTEVPSWEADGEAPSRPSAPRMRWLQDGFFFSGRSRKKRSPCVGVCGANVRAQAYAHGHVCARARALAVPIRLIKQS